MKNLFLLLFLFICSVSFAQQIPHETETMYEIGYATGENLALDCDNPHRSTLYRNTIKSDLNTDYKNGFREGYQANLGGCGPFNNNTGGSGISQTAAEFYCENLQIFCGEVPTDQQH